MFVSSGTVSRGVIYLARNRVNGKIYIGLSIYGLEKRRNRHLRAAERGSHYYFHCALRKYGPEVFDWEVVTCGAFHVLPTLERAVITEYKAAGYVLYNQTDGGEGTLNPSPELRAKFKAANERPEVRARRSAAQKEAQNRPAVVEKRSEAMRAKFSSPEINIKWSEVQKIAKNRPDSVVRNRAAQKIAQNRPEVKAKANASRQRTRERKRAAARAEGEAAMARLLATIPIDKPS